MLVIAHNCNNKGPIRGILQYLWK